MAYNDVRCRCLPCRILLWLTLTLTSLMGMGTMAHKTLRGLTWKKVCYVCMLGSFVGVTLVTMTISAMPATFNMRVIPSIQEINAMFIITSASRTCDDASLPDQAMAKSKYPIPPFVDEDKFTIIINTFKRTHLLLESLKHYCQMQNVHKIIVYWSNVGIKPPDFRTLLRPPVPIVVNHMPATGLSLRFSPSSLIETEGVFNVDDDLIIEEEDVQHAFSVWKYHPHGLVGFTPRTHVESGEGSYKYYRLPLWVGNYSLILTNAAFMHKQYLSVFTNELPQEMKSFIDKYTNCEDIAMNFVVNQHCKCTGVFYVKPKHQVLDFGNKDGLSNRAQHAEIRDFCIAKLRKLYPDVSLGWVRCRY